MKKLLLTIPLLALLTAGCSNDDLWDDFPKSDKEFIKSINDENNMADYYYKWDGKYFQYTSPDSINWEYPDFVDAYGCRWMIDDATDEIWIRGKNILTLYDPAKLDALTTLNWLWSNYCAEYRVHYRLYVAKPYDVISPELILPDASRLHSINANECVTFRGGLLFLFEGGYPQRYGYWRNIKTYKAVTTPPFTNQVITFGSGREAVTFAIETLRKAYGDTIWNRSKNDYILMDSLLINPGTKWYP